MEGNSPRGLVDGGGGYYRHSIIIVILTPQLLTQQTGEPTKDQRVPV